MPSLKFGIIYVKKENILLNRLKASGQKQRFPVKMWKC